MNQLVPKCLEQRWARGSRGGIYKEGRPLDTTDHGPAP